MLLFSAVATASFAAEQVKLHNPISVDYLEQHLRKEHPRLVFTPEMVDQLRAKVKTDPVISNMYAAVKLNAETVFDEPLLEREMTGKRLLFISRAMLYRVNMLGVVYLVEGDRRMLERLNEEILSVCAFTDWNPPHFLDTAEMSLAVALALDWTDGVLPESTVKTASAALISKGLLPNGWTSPWICRNENNWNQVCNGGMIAAAIAVADTHPELSAHTIKEALDALPFALQEYRPDGVYPEGSSYWEYGTKFSVVTAAMLESAFGSDFGHLQYPGFKESAVFRLMCNTPAGGYYNYADCSDRRSLNGDMTLAWFAAKTGIKAFFEKERFLLDPEQMEKPDRLAGASLAWLCQYEETADWTRPVAWKGDGPNPIVIFTGGENDPHQYYFGGKGGRATSSHGNMDAGSFIFELNGIRWVIDSGNQDYTELEKTGFDLWGNKQDSERWTLLTKNNFGHSTISVNNKPFVVDGFAPLIDFKAGEQPEATFDLTAVYGESVKRALRRFVKDEPTSLLIEDQIEISEATEQIVWQLMTTAEVEVINGGAVLRQDGKSLQLENLSHPELEVAVVTLDPPPLELDRKINGLKRLEIRIPAASAVGGKIAIKIKLTTMEKAHD
jgi:hypothetical protein